MPAAAEAGEGADRGRKTLNFVAALGAAIRIAAPKASLLVPCIRSRLGVSLRDCHCCSHPHKIFYCSAVAHIAQPAAFL